MATKISWCDETINPVVGCSKLSAGCQNCYAESMARRLANMGLEQYKQVTMDTKQPGHVTPFGAWNGATAFIESELEKPGKWRKPRTIFVSSMGDLFHESVRMEWIEQIVGMVAANPQHTFIFLTKRAGRMKECLGKLDQAFFSALYQLQAGTSVEAWNWPLPNLALGISAENQQTADERIPLLLETPAAIRFVSLEPIVGPIDLNRIHEIGTTSGGAHWESWESCLTGRRFDPWSDGEVEGCPKLDGVILGGESKPKGRRLDPQWVMMVRDQCADAGVPFMFKQWHHENRNEVDPATGFPFLQDSRTHTALAW